jgi:hypothetical protein
MGRKKLFSARRGKQLTVFLEDRPGTLAEVIDVLRENKVNMLALSLAEGVDIGYLRITVDKFQEARKALEKNGHLVLERDVVLLEVANAPGGMATAIDQWAKAGINIEYAYSASGPGAERSLIVARVLDPDKAIAALKYK